MEHKDNLWTCKECGKQKKLKHHIRNHIESLHMEGGSHGCNQCGKTYKTRSSLAHHACIENDSLVLPKMSKLGEGWTCNECGKSNRSIGLIKYHVASIHLKVFK